MSKLKQLMIDRGIARYHCLLDSRPLAKVFNAGLKFKWLEFIIDPRWMFYDFKAINSFRGKLDEIEVSGTVSYYMIDNPEEVDHLMELRIGTIRI